MGWFVQTFWQLNVEDVLPTFELQKKALSWAERLNQSKTYDATYLAAAEMLQAEFWTADRHLAQAAKEAGAIRLTRSLKPTKNKIA